MVKCAGHTKMRIANRASMIVTHTVQPVIVLSPAMKLFIIHQMIQCAMTVGQMQKIQMRQTILRLMKLTDNIFLRSVGIGYQVKSIIDDL